MQNYLRIPVVNEWTTLDYQQNVGNTGPVEERRRPTRPIDFQHNDLIETSLCRATFLKNLHEDLLSYFT